MLRSTRRLPVVSGGLRTFGVSEAGTVLRMSLRPLMMTSFVFREHSCVRPARGLWAVSSYSRVHCHQISNPKP